MTATEPARQPTIVDPVTPYYFEAVKILGTGNSTGLFGAIVALYYFGSKGPAIQFWIMVAAIPYMIGICLFTAAFASLTFFAIRQTTLGPPNHRRIETLRRWTVYYALLSFLAWWVGTVCAGRVLYLLWWVDWRVPLGAASS
jgi:hypothetical protein